MSKSYGVFDWAGRPMFCGRTFATADDASDEVYDLAKATLGADCTADSYDSFVEDFYVDQSDPPPETLWPTESSPWKQATNG